MEGRVPPIAKHNGQPTLEKEAFALRPGELSGVIQLGDKFVILFCEGYTTPEPVEYEKVRDLIRDDIREKKLHLAMSELLDHLQETAAVDNFLAGKSHAADHAPPERPARRRPGGRPLPRAPRGARPRRRLEGAQSIADLGWGPCERHECVCRLSRRAQLPRHEEPMLSL